MPDDHDSDTVAPELVRIPIRRPADPFAAAELLECPADTAAHWSDRVWHDRPPR